MYNGQSCGTFWGIQWTTTLQHTTVLFRLYPSKRILSSHASAFNHMSIKHVFFFLWHAPIQWPVGILLVTPLGVFKYIFAFGHVYQEDGMVRKHTYHITYYRTRNPQWAMVMSYRCFTGKKQPKHEASGSELLCMKPRVYKNWTVERCFPIWM